MRIVWLALGVVATALGVLGAVLPLLPTTPFLLLAAYCFARSSPTLHVWLTTHPTFGPAILDWQRHGAIGRRAKRMAIVAIAASFVLSVVLGVPAWVLAAQFATLGAVTAFILSRPSPPE